MSIEFHVWQNENGSWHLSPPFGDGDYPSYEHAIQVMKDMAAINDIPKDAALVMHFKGGGVNKLYPGGMHPYAEPIIVTPTEVKVLPLPQIPVITKEEKPKYEEYIKAGNKVEIVEELPQNNGSPEEYGDFVLMDMTEEEAKGFTDVDGKDW